MTQTPKRLFLLLSLFFAPLLAGKVQAATYSPPNNYDLCQNAGCTYQEQTLRKAIEVSCAADGDDIITFDKWSSSHPDSKVITVDGPLVIPSSCKGKVKIVGRDGSDGVDVTLKANDSRISADQCILDIQSNGNEVYNLNIVSSSGKGICVNGNDNKLGKLQVGRKLVAGSNDGNNIGIEINGDNNSLFESAVVSSASHGVLLTGTSNKLSKNYIGTTKANEESAAPTSDQGNGGDGVRIDGAMNQVGGSTTLKNYIANNGGIGIAVVGGASNHFNNLGYNSIYGNGELGIDIMADGPTGPEAGACSSGPNDCIDFPSMVRSNPFGTNQYLIEGRAPAGSEVQIYFVKASDGDSHGEGKVYLSKVSLPAGDINTTKSFTALVAGTGLVDGVKISLLASRAEEVDGQVVVNTSEFSGTITTHGDPSGSPDPRPTPPLCGDGNVDDGEQCDDNNTANGDGCNSACEFEGTPPPTSTPTATPTATPTPGVCGNGVLESGEQCDDGNTNDTDGCNNSCVFTGDSCGDSVVEPGEGEQCDDGNNTNGDGCSEYCQLENLPLCGNGAVNPGEQCDDGNTTPGDGCSQFCQNEGPTPTPTVTPGPTATPGPTSTPTPTPGVTDCPPTSLIATAVSAHQIDLSWVDNCPNEMGYKIERGDPNLDCANVGVDATFDEVGTVGVNVTTYQDLGAPTPPLASNTTYCYRVRAFFGGFLFSDYSNKDDAKTFTAPVDVPSSPTHLIATAISSSQIDVNWIDNSNNETAFELWRSQGDCSSFVFLTDSIAANVTTYVDTGLSPSTLYCYKVRAKNPIGTSNFSNADDATTFGVPTTVPTAATNLVAVAVSSSQIDITWNDNATNEEGYKIERSQHPTCELGLGFVELAVPLGPNTTSYNDTGLTASTRYCYRVRPFNSQGNGAYSNIDDATTLDIPGVPPIAPITLQADGVTSSRIDIQFVDASDNENGFVLERAPGACADSNPFAPIANLPASPGVAGGVQYHDLGLPANSVFCYRVKATNPAGDSPYSNIDDASTLAVPGTIPTTPIDLTATATGPHQIRVTWTDASNNEDHFVVQRADGLCTAGNPFSDIATVPAVIGSGSVVTFFDNSVDDAHSYCYRVISTNIVGDSLPSNTDDATTPADPICTAGDIDNDNICDDSLDGNPDPDSGEGPPGTDTDGDGTPDAGDTDTDDDNIFDDDEEGDGDVNTPPIDTDGDGTPDFRDEDSDDDGIDDDDEAGDDDPNTDPVDTDGDGTPDFQDPDSDNDGIPDGSNGTPIDNCRIIVNPDQKDTDGDGLGDACDPTPGTGTGDQDGDGIPDDQDNCPTVPNADQTDTDDDGIGDACDPTPGTGFFPSLQGSGCSLNPAAASINGLLPLGAILMPGLFYGLLRRKKK